MSVVFQPNSGPLGQGSKAGCLGSKSSMLDDIASIDSIPKLRTVVFKGGLPTQFSVSISSLSKEKLLASTMTPREKLFNYKAYTEADPEFSKFMQAESGADFDPGTYTPTYKSEVVLMTLMFKLFQLKKGLPEVFRIPINTFIDDMKLAFNNLSEGSHQDDQTIKLDKLMDKLRVMDDFSGTSIGVDMRVISHQVGHTPADTAVLESQKLISVQKGTINIEVLDTPHKTIRELLSDNLEELSKKEYDPSNITIGNGVTIKKVAEWVSQGTAPGIKKVIDLIRQLGKLNDIGDFFDENLETDSDGLSPEAIIRRHLTRKENTRQLTFHVLDLIKKSLTAESTVTLRDEFKEHLSREKLRSDRSPVLQLAHMLGYEFTESLAIEMVKNLKDFCFMDRSASSLEVDDIQHLQALYRRLLSMKNLRSKLEDNRVAISHEKKADLLGELGQAIGKLDQWIEENKDISQTDLRRIKRQYSTTDSIYYNAKHELYSHKIRLNEDAGCVHHDPDGCSFTVVTDGISMSSLGRESASEAVFLLEEKLKELGNSVKTMVLQPEEMKLEIAARLKELFVEVNDILYKKFGDNGGTTLTVAFSYKDGNGTQHILNCNSGDSEVVLRVRKEGKDSFIHMSAMGFNYEQMMRAATRGVQRGYYTTNYVRNLSSVFEPDDSKSAFITLNFDPCSNSDVKEADSLHDQFVRSQHTLYSPAFYPGSKPFPRSGTTKDMFSVSHYEIQPGEEVEIISYSDGISDGFDSDQRSSTEQLFAGRPLAMAGMVSLFEYADLKDGGPKLDDVVMVRLNLSSPDRLSERTSDIYTGTANGYKKVAGLIEREGALDAHTDADGVLNFTEFVIMDEFKELKREYFRSIAAAADPKRIPACILILGNSIMRDYFGNVLPMKAKFMQETILAVFTLGDEKKEQAAFIRLLMVLNSIVDPDGDWDTETAQSIILKDDPLTRESLLSIKDKMNPAPKQQTLDINALGVILTPTAEEKIKYKLKPGFNAFLKTFQTQHLSFSEMFNAYMNDWDESTVTKEKLEEYHHACIYLIDRFDKIDEESLAENIREKFKTFKVVVLARKVAFSLKIKEANTKPKPEQEITLKTCLDPDTLFQDFSSKRDAVFEQTELAIDAFIPKQDGDNPDPRTDDLNRMLKTLLKQIELNNIEDPIQQEFELRRFLILLGTLKQENVKGYVKRNFETLLEGFILEASPETTNRHQCVLKERFLEEINVAIIQRIAQKFYRNPNKSLNLSNSFHKVFSARLKTIRQGTNERERQIKVKRCRLLLEMCADLRAELNLYETNDNDVFIKELTELFSHVLDQPLDVHVERNDIKRKIKTLFDIEYMKESPVDMRAEEGSLTLMDTATFKTFKKSLLKGYDKKGHSPELCRALSGSTTPYQLKERFITYFKTTEKYNVPRVLNLLLMMEKNLRAEQGALSDEYLMGFKEYLRWEIALMIQQKVDLSVKEDLTSNTVTVIQTASFSDTKLDKVDSLKAMFVERLSRLSLPDSGVGFMIQDIEGIETSTVDKFYTQLAEKIKSWNDIEITEDHREKSVVSFCHYLRYLLQSIPDKKGFGVDKISAVLDNLIGLLDQIDPKDSIEEKKKDLVESIPNCFQAGALRAVLFNTSDETTPFEVLMSLFKDQGEYKENKPTIEYVFSETIKQLNMIGAVNSEPFSLYDKKLANKFNSDLILLKQDFKNFIESIERSSETLEEPQRLSLERLKDLLLKIEGIALVSV